MATGRIMALAGAIKASVEQLGFREIKKEQEAAITKLGRDFHKEYAKLGELRGFCPPHVHMKALATTASLTSRKKIIKTLGVNKPHMLVKCPYKNIIYSVKKTDDIDSF
uniref:Uncharacterized protein n=1 Tax=Amphimedon queenslandica TaxID=400682 RepID=A0A1X7UT19_AMPQE